MISRKKPSRSFPDRRGREAGSAAVEFALVSLPLILLVLGTYDYFAASYQSANLAGAARAVTELARDDQYCKNGHVTATNCLTDITSLINTMKSNTYGTNNTLSSVICCNDPATDPVSTTTPLQAAYVPTYYYTCAYQNVLSTTAPTSCNPPGCTSGCDTRVLQYVQVSVKEGLARLFSWDPWSSSNPLVARAMLRTQ